RRAVHDALFAEQHRLDLRTVDHHGDHDLGPRGRLRGRGGDRGTVLGRPRVGGRPGAVVDDEIVAGANQVGGHPRAHDPEADEADIHLPGQATGRIAPWLMRAWEWT